MLVAAHIPQVRGGVRFRAIRPMCSGAFVGGDRRRTARGGAGLSVARAATPISRNNNLHGAGVSPPTRADGGAVPCKAPGTLPGELWRRASICARRRFFPVQE